MKRVIAGMLCLVMILSLIPGVAIWADAADENNGQQIVYEGGTVSSEDGNVIVSKTIAPTDKENYFDVTLTVQNREIIEESTVDVVIVLDISNTMNSTESGNDAEDAPTRLDNAKAAAVSFAMEYANADNLSYNRRLGVVTFNSDATAYVQLEQVTQSTINQIQSITAPGNESDRRFTNIEGGLKMAEDMLSRSNAAHKFVVLITDGFPTTYTETTDSSGKMLGYDVTNANLERFKDQELGVYCTYGTNYSDEAARRAEAVAMEMKEAGINIVSIGIDVNNEAQTIQNYLNKLSANTSYSTIQRAAGIHPNGYIIGSATDSTSYRIWLGTDIGGGKDVTNGYYTGDSAAELAEAFSEIMANVFTSVTRYMNNPQPIVDPMGEHVEFLGFYNLEGVLSGNSLTGTHTEGGENTATYGSAINWILNQSGFTKDDTREAGVVYYTYSITYRVRLENELPDFVEGQSYDANGDVTLEYDGPDDEPEPPIEFPKPEVEGYLGELSFTKLSTDGVSLPGAEFTLTHDADCPVCGGTVAIADQVVTSDASGLVSFTAIPSGHTYTLTESKSPAGYQENTETYAVVVSYGETTCQDIAGGTVENTPAEPAELELSGVKTVDADMDAAGYTFLLKDINGNVIDEAVSAADGSFSFEKLTFTSAGTWFYEIVERAGSDSNVIYDTTVYHVTVTVTQSGNSFVAEYTIRNHGTGEAAEQISFHNADRKPAQVQLTARKILEGGQLTSDAFTFVLADEQGNVEDTKTNNSDGYVVFDWLTFDQEGTYIYTISEVIPDNPDIYMDYDEQVIQVTVEVSAEDGHDHYVAKVTYSGGEALFTNVIRDAGDADFSFVKTDEDGAALSGAEFTLRHMDCGCGVDIPDQTAAADANGVVSFRDVPSGHQYILEETVVPSGFKKTADRHVTVSFGKVYIDGVETTETSPVVIRNVLVDDAELILKAEKTMTGITGQLQAVLGTFEFVLEKLVDGQWVEIDRQHNMDTGEDNTIVNEVIFDALLYTADDIGTHEYRIYEVDAGDPDVICDQKVYELTVYVDDTDMDGALDVHYTVDGVESGTMVFSNRMRKPVQAVLEASKVLLSGNNTISQEDKFTFLLKDADGNILQEVTNDGSAIVFDALTFREPGVFTYTIQERVDNAAHVVYDMETARVTITVTAPENSDSYAVEIVYDKNGVSGVPVFTNTYRGHLSLRKSDANGNALAGAEFTLTHSPDCCDTQIEPMTAVSRSDGYIVFSAIASGHRYTLVETVVPDGCVQAPDHIVEVVKGVVTVYEADGTTVEHDHTIINYPQAKVEITGFKQLVGRALAEGEFAFELVDEAGNVVSVSNQADGYFTFPALNYTEPGVYVYTVREAAGQVPGVTYSGVVYTVTVTVSDLGDGQLHAQVSYAYSDGQRSNTETGGILFTNTYTAKPASVELGGVKYLTGDRTAPKSGEFFFQLFAADENYDPQGDALELVSNDADGAYAFSLITYHGVGTYYYVIQELDIGLGGVTYDRTLHYIQVVVTDDGEGQLVATVNGQSAEGLSFDYTNGYAVTGSAEAVLAGIKYMTGRDLAEGEFTFELVDEAGDVLQTVTNAADGTFVFQPMTYEKEDIGLHHYVVREAQGDLGGVEYDPTIYDVTVRVYDNGAGGLGCAVNITVDGAVAEDISFTNNYAPNGVNVLLEGTKTLIGRDLTAGEFRFTLTDEKGNVIILTHDEAGDLQFPTLHFTTPGTYVYELREEAGDEAFLTYDESVFRVTITVTDNQNGALTASWEITDLDGNPVEEIAFTNVCQVPDEIKVPIIIRKSVECKDGYISPAGFLFLLEDGSGMVRVTTVSDLFGHAGFVFSYTQEDVGKTFTYTITEINTGIDGVEYSTAVYEVEITIVLNEQTNELEAVITVNGKLVDEAVCRFINTYDEPEEPTEPTEPEPTEPEPTEPEPTEPEPTEPEPTEPEPTEPEPTEPEPTEPEPTEPEPTDPEPTEPAPTEPEPTEPDGPDIPYTGMLWWPVPVMLAGGAVLLMAGIRRKDDEDEA